MQNRKWIYGILFGLLALAIIAGYILYFNLKKPELQVIFLDVGQGDAILIQEGNYQMLIDGGKDGKIMLEKLGQYLPFWDRQIEVVVMTHPDQDHIGGLVEVFKNYQIDSVIKTKDISESQTFDALLKEVGSEEANVVEAMAGTKIKLPSGTESEVLYPFSNVAENSKNNSNDDSVVIKLTWGQESFLFTGDLPSEKETQLIDKNIDLKSIILKVSHHGSKYSTSDLFLDKVQPAQAVISVGAKNMYGHPNPEALDRLKRHNVEILRTDEGGDIVFECQIIKAKCQMAL
jgi:competence protein ComEC